jgi:acetyl-CoA carboxylase biotin carboxyl carrier protein
MRAPPAVMQAAPAPVAMAASSPTPGPAHAPVDSTGVSGQPADDPAAHPGAVPSPMVGTVYLQPEPGVEPFIRVGSSVSAGQTILIVEAMKTMNQIAAPHGGTVTRILVEDGSPVEYGAPLVIIE